MRFELFIAHRLYSDDTKGGKQYSRPAVRIALAGIAIGILVMIVSLSVVLGFKREVAAKVTGFGSHIQLLSLTYDSNRQMLPVRTNDSLLNIVRSFPEVNHVQTFALKMGMLKTDSDFCGITFKGIGTDYDTTFLSTSCIEGNLPQADSTTAQLLISRRTANQLRLKVGDRIFAYFLTSESMRARRFTICGLFQTNMSEYDTSYALTDLHTVQRLNDWQSYQSSGYEVTINDFSKLQDVTLRMAQRINNRPDPDGVIYGVYSIRELAPHTFSWLSVLDMNVVMIIILMICVSVFTVVSGLLIIMLDKIKMIGTFKSFGATNSSIRRVFSCFAVMLVGRGLIIGNVLGLLLCYLQQLFHIVRLDASVYYIPYVPIQMNYLYIIMINVITIVVISLVIFGSSHLISLSNPTKTMNYE